jgi:hypothetical protein
MDAYTSTANAAPEPPFPDESHQRFRFSHLFSTPLYTIAGIDATLIRTCRFGEYAAAIILGLLVLSGATLTFVGVSATINTTLGNLGWLAYLIGLLVASIMIMIDSTILHASWFSLGQILAQQRGMIINGGATQKRRMLAGLPRLIGSTCGSVFFGLIIVLILLRPDLLGQQDKDWRRINGPIAAAVSNEIDARNKVLEDQYNIAKTKTDSLFQQISATRATKPDIAAIDTEIAAFDDKLKQREKLSDQAYKASQLAACELVSGADCNNQSIGKPGDGPRHKKANIEAILAKQRVSEFDAMLGQEKTRIDRLKDKRSDLLSGSTLSNTTQIAILNDSLQQSQIKLETAGQVYNAALQDRNNVINVELRKRNGYTEKETGFIADIKALDELVGQSWTLWLWVTALKGVIIALESAAIWLHLFSLTPSMYALRLAMRFEYESGEMLTVIRRHHNLQERVTLDAEVETIAKRSIHDLYRDNNKGV